ncbi:MAG: selenocysteine-specific translation elongation factor [Acidimicrobiia bacterium]|nr:selenocysteine-specific translation elongation factor [Acidimicrobiia bacterium]
MPIVGTAGHVDHGKSTLIAALTGRDPDRWKEEKERGLTIDLGFAWIELETDLDVGFVDVPGHERFVKNMLAGVGGIDVALFVVAADEGWMPQTEEHAMVLDLLDIRHGVVALTRSDLVDDEFAELVELEVAEKLEGTSLEDASIVRVSAVTGAGLEDLRRALGEALTRAGQPTDFGRPRLWVDRSFVISGAGTVVTGTLVDGSIEMADELALYPGQRQVRVRSIQSHEQTVTEAVPGSRTAINLVGLERTEVERGSMVGRPGQWRESAELLVDLRTPRSLGEAVTNRGAYQFHIGSAAVPARLRLVDGGKIEAGSEPTAALVRLDRTVPCASGDRFILREVGRRSVVGGGVVLDPAPQTRQAFREQAAVALREARRNNTVADALLELRGAASDTDLERDSGGGTASGGVAADGHRMSLSMASQTGQKLLTVVERFHSANPLRAGMPKAEVLALSNLPARLAELVIEDVGLVDDGATVRLESFAGGWSSANEEALEAARDALLADGLGVRRAGQLELDGELMHAALREGRLVKVADDLVYLPEQIDEIQRRTRLLTDGFTVGDFRDALGVSRRQAVPLLEWLDRTHVTRRVGDGREIVG